MGDRRLGDRRDRENGVIRIRFKDAVKYIIVGVILIISIAANIVLSVKLNQYKKMTELYLDSSDDIIDDESIDEVDVDELMNSINTTTNENTQQ